MNNNRRNFLKLFGLAGAGIIADVSKPVSGNPALSGVERLGPAKRNFNMSGYAAPKLEKVRIGYIGLGNRGPGHAVHASKIEGVEIKALCDVRPERVAVAKAGLPQGNNPTLYSGSINEWKKLCDRQDIDLVYIATPWNQHAAMAVYAMQHGKHVAIEVPAAVTLDECWQLVEISEKTKKHCVLLENCCYDFFELLTLNMARQGMFGEIVHTEGAYIHDLARENFNKKMYWDMWRLKENATRNGNLYPTHGLGPIAQVMNLNRGDKMDYLVSVSSSDFMMKQLAGELAAKDDFYKQYTGNNFRGNMNTTTIRTAKGRTLMLQHDVTSPRPYSRIHLVSGTKGTAQKYPLKGRIAIEKEAKSTEEWLGAKRLEWLSEEEYKEVETKYTPAIVKKVGEMAKQIGGHGGMDFMMNWRLIDCLRNGLPVDIDVYDAALWSAIAPLTERSVAKRVFVDVPDFTSGNWKSNTPVDISLAKAGNTQVRM